MATEKPDVSSIEVVDTDYGDTADDDETIDDNGSGGDGSGEGGGVEEMSPEELVAHFGPRRCKPQPVEPCQNSTFGCCPGLANKSLLRMEGKSMNRGGYCSPLFPQPNPLSRSQTLGGLFELTQCLQGT